MASGPETPGLACLMFSIPKRLPTPAPAWEPGAVGRRDWKAALASGGARNWAGFGVGENSRAEMLGAGRRQPRLWPPPTEAQAGTAGVLKARRQVGAGNASAAGAAALGEGLAWWEVAWGPPNEIRARPRATPRETLRVLTTPGGGGGPRAPVQRPCRKKAALFPTARD